MNATQLELRRGTADEHALFTGANGEITYNTTTKTLHVHDGSTAGGFPLARADQTGNARFSTSPTDPNGVVMGSPGDACTARDTFKIWQKTSGVNTNTGWE